MAEHHDHYLTPEQLDFLKKLLMEQKMELLREGAKTVGENIAPIEEAGGDFGDLSTHETGRDFLLRLRERDRKLINKIDKALERIEDGSYGYCEVTGDEIGFNRLKARPMTTLSKEAQEAKEEEENM